MIYNNIETEWGNIIEIDRNEERSVALIVVNPGAVKPQEYHDTRTEVFSNEHGTGVIILNHHAAKKMQREVTRTIHPETIYELANPTDHFWLFYVTSTPPFDPNDVHVIEQKIPTLQK